MRTSDYIETAKKLLNINSAELSRRIGVSDASMSRYESGERIIDDYSAVRLAELMKINPMRLIVKANIERLVKAGKEEEEKDKHYFWLKLSQRLEEEAKKNKELII